MISNRNIPNVYQESEVTYFEQLDIHFKDITAINEPIPSRIHEVMSMVNLKYSIAIKIFERHNFSVYTQEHIVIDDMRVATMRRYNHSHKVFTRYSNTIRNNNEKLRATNG